MQHLEDIITTARINTEDRERRAALRRLGHEATAGRPSLLYRITHFGRRTAAPPNPRIDPEPQRDLEVVHHHR